MKIGVFDIDGVVADFNELLVDICGEGRGLGFYNLDDRYDGETLARAWEIQNDANYYYPLKAIVEGIEFVKDTLRRGYEVLFLTSRPDVGSMKSFTKRWLQRELRLAGVDYERTLGVQFVLNKSLHLETFKKDILFFVDDNPEEIHEAKLCGIPVFSWEQPWNEKVFPKLFPYSGEIGMQLNDSTECEYFWNFIERNK